MAELRFDQLDAVTTPVTTDILPVVQSPDDPVVANKRNKKLTLAQLSNFVKGQIGTASTSNDGILSQGDWQIFNAKASISQLNTVSASIPEAAMDAVGAMTADSATIDATYNDAGDTLTLIVADGSIDSTKVGNVSIVDIAATSYTLLATDRNKILRFTAGTAVTVTVPTSLPIGSVYGASQNGVGAVTFVAGAGNNLRNPDGHFRLSGQYAKGSIEIFTATEARFFGYTRV
jgi:hypothetical protein